LASAEERLVELDVVELAGGLRVYEARTWATRRDGLGELPDLPADWGLLIAPCRSIHTMGMRFPLDLVWLDGRGRVRGVSQDVAPRRVRADLAARSVIEVCRGRGETFAEAWDAHPRRRSGAGAVDGS